MKNILSAAGLVVLAIAVVFGLGYLTVAFIAGPGEAIQQQQRDVERRVNQYSQQYVETQVRAMRDQINRYNENAVEIAKLQGDESNANVVEAIRTQQNGIVNFVKQQAKNLPPSALPSDIAQFIASH